MLLAVVSEDVGWCRAFLAVEGECWGALGPRAPRRRARVALACVGGAGWRRGRRRVRRAYGAAGARRGRRGVRARRGVAMEAWWGRVAGARPPSRGQRGDDLVLEAALPARDDEDSSRARRGARLFFFFSFCREKQAEEGTKAAGGAAKGGGGGGAGTRKVKNWKNSSEAKEQTGEREPIWRSYKTRRSRQGTTI